VTDQQTKDYIQAWGVQDVPTASVSHGKFPLGRYHAFALLGWVKQRKANWPVIGLQLTVLEQGGIKAIGGLTMGLPITPKSDRQVCLFLEDLGWDGRVWPYKDHGWPEGMEEEPGLLSLLRTAKLGATLTFPPCAQGTPTVSIPVHHRSKPFSVAPFVEQFSDPQYLNELRLLANDPTPFASDWAAQESRT
jgi:hypothetical protein